MLQKAIPALIYVADPMCSWCYAFGPELDRILDETGLPLEMVAGGLFVGDQIWPLDDNLRAYLTNTWGRVHDLSGRPVSYDLVSWDTWTYDTEPANRALVSVREGEFGEAFEFFNRVQAAFYAHSKDVTRTEVLSKLAGRDLELDDPAIVQKTRDDFARAKQLGAHGFPTLLLDTGDEQIIVAAGYVKAQQALRSINLFLG